MSSPDVERAVKHPGDGRVTNELAGDDPGPAVFLQFENTHGYRVSPV